jgi:diguanylate cyclase (GGDEF)-like protein
LSEVAIVAEKLRAAVEELPPVVGGMASESTSVTLSVGGTSLSPEVVDPQVLLSYADQALYEAKRRGRNQVQMYGAGA